MLLLAQVAHLAAFLNNLIAAQALHFVSPYYRFWQD